MEDGDRPFNYFQTQNRTASVSTGTLNNVPTQQMQPNYSSYQANNYVQPNLQRSSVDGANSQSSFLSDYKTVYMFYRSSNQKPFRGIVTDPTRSQGVVYGFTRSNFELHAMLILWSYTAI